MTTEQLNIVVPGLTTIAGAAIGAWIAYLVGRQQFKATVISSNRQTWINTLRDTISEYQSCVSAMSILIANKNIHEVIDSNEFRERVARVEFLRSKIRLLINPNEADHLKLVENISVPITGCQTDEDLKKMITAREELPIIAQKILKREWERVKKGN
ncbi:MAG: hypothetical protein WBN75_14815 [Verrucomicrobiia bacterium]